MSNNSLRRRVPQQARAAKTVAGLLDAAAAVIAEVGYESATLTAIAARAGASIGSLYQYFPDKAAVARSLAERYGTELADDWARLVVAARSWTVEQLVDRMFETVLQFQSLRPAFLALTASSEYRHTKAARGRLRGHIAGVLRAQQPGLSAAEAARAAEVTVQIFKGMNHAFVHQAEEERRALSSEFKLALLAYLRARLKPKAEA